MKEAVQKAIDSGITIVAAAGNESTDEYSFPASFEGVISVGSTNERNKLSSYSITARLWILLHQVKTFIVPFMMRRKDHLLSSLVEHPWPLLSWQVSPLFLNPKTHL